MTDTTYLGRVKGMHALARGLLEDMKGAKRPAHAQVQPSVQLIYETGKLLSDLEIKLDREYNKWFVDRGEGRT